MGYKVYVTLDRCESFGMAVLKREFVSEEFETAHMALAWVVGAFNDQEVNSAAHWLYVVDEEMQEILM